MDAAALRIFDGFEGVFFTIDENVAAVFVVDATEDFHQRGFARAIFTHQRMYLTIGEFKRHIV